MHYKRFTTFRRNEICSNNPADFGLKKGLEHLREVREKFLGITERYTTFPTCRTTGCHSRPDDRFWATRFDSAMSAMGRCRKFARPRTCRGRGTAAPREPYDRCPSYSRPSRQPPFARFNDSLVPVSVSTPVSGHRQHSLQSGPMPSSAEKVRFPALSLGLVTRIGTSGESPNALRAGGLLRTFRFCEAQAFCRPRDRGMTADEAPCRRADFRSRSTRRWHR